MADQMFQRLFWSVFAILFLGPSFSHPRIERGYITAPEYESWKFVTRFCFLSRTGRLEFEFSYPKEYDEGQNAAQNILLYHDNQWPSVYDEERNLQKLLRGNEEDAGAVAVQSCYDKENFLLPENNQVINLTVRYRWSGCVITKVGLTDWYTCRGGRTFASIRERWWYIVVSNCATTKGLFLNYSLTMTNSLADDVFFKHFSADEFYILQETIAFLAAYSFLLLLSMYVAYSLHIRQLYHTTYKLYMGSMCVEFLALISQIIYWADYGATGIPKIGWKNLGRFLEYLGQVLFLILLILMGKGYTITRGRISTGGVIKLIIFSVIFIAMSITMFVWEVVGFDPALVLYVYDNIPGYILISVKIASWLWFLYAIFFTLKHYPEKMVFYIPFAVIYTLWFWLGTSVALAAIDLIPKWLREKVVQGCVLFATFIGHLIFLILTWPTMANKTFPYHIKTTQVGVMENPPSAEAPNYSSNGEAISGGAYGPSNGRHLNMHEPIGEKQFIDMFTTDHSKTNGRAHIANPDRFPHAHS